MAKPADDMPAAAEKGRLIAALATKGVTGVDLAAIANKSRKEISELVVSRILEMKGA